MRWFTIYKSGYHIHQGWETQINLGSFFKPDANGAGLFLFLWACQIHQVQLAHSDDLFPALYQCLRLSYYRLRCLGRFNINSEDAMGTRAVTIHQGLTSSFIFVAIWQASQQFWNGVTDSYLAILNLNPRTTILFDLKPFLDNVRSYKL